MSTILIAWELGGNYGHLTKTLPIAEALRNMGHQIFYTARDLAVAEELLASRKIPFFAVPLPLKPKPLTRPPGNYAELLLAEGYGNAPMLAGQVRAWLSLLDLVQPSVVVIDHAPTAAIAARIANIPIISIDTSFELPPHPLPPIRPFDRQATNVLQGSEATVMGVINRILNMHNTAALPTLSELFPASGQLLSTFPELDHFGIRKHATYLGPIVTASSNEAAEWPPGESPRVFAYLRSQIAGTAATLRALDEMMATALCVVSGLPPTRAAQLTKPNLKVLTKTVAVEKLLLSADIVVSHGGGLTSSALANGVPVLILPHTIEQLLQGLRVRELGAGIVVERDRNHQTILNMLRELTENPKYRIAARNFSENHRELNLASSVRLATAHIEKAINDYANR